MAVFITNSVWWTKFERAGVGQHSAAALSWMFRNSKIPWEFLPAAGVRFILNRFGITEGSPGIDDTGRKRSKKTKKISRVHKLKDRVSGGFVMGQCIVFLILATPKIAIPVGFSFYMPDPELTKWNKRKKELKKDGVPQKQHPRKPPKNVNCPTKQEISLKILKQFRYDFPDVRIRCIPADALHRTGKFMDTASSYFGGAQVVSQLKRDQNAVFRNKKISVSEYFTKHPGANQKTGIRGGDEISAVMGSARLRVCSHGKKRFVIALKCDGEDDCRYIAASDMSWRTQDIAEAYTLRRFAEVFIQDWKSHEGWGKLTGQTGEEGSEKSLILSLLCDLRLFFHPGQLTRSENKLPVSAVGSLTESIKAESIPIFVKELLNSDNPHNKINILSDDLKKLFCPTPSKKHLIDKVPGRLEPSPSLKYKEG
ncbi:MAG: transposase [Desulfobacterales bacterium]